jgi:ATP-dependent Clp protease protease subunit
MGACGTPPHRRSFAMSDKDGADFFPPRLITLSGSIDMGMIERVSDVLAAMNAVSRKPIAVHIASGGGMMHAGGAIYDLIRCSPAPVTTVGFGVVASAAVIVFQAGGRRLLSPMSRIVLHEAKITIDGDLSAHDLLMAARDIAEDDERLDKLIAERCRQPLKRIQAWSQESKEFFAADAVKHRLADGILAYPKSARTKSAKRRRA